jgi:hypothetical protein
MPKVTTLGVDFARALAKKEPKRLRALLASEIDFQAMTPRQAWEASDPDAVLSILFSHWFEDADDIETLESIDTDSFADRQRVGYRFSVSNPEGSFLVEQQAYFSGREGKIVWMRVLCSGFRPTPLDE